MKKVYEMPVAELVNFEITESIMVIDQQPELFGSVEDWG